MEFLIEMVKTMLCSNAAVFFITEQCPTMLSKGNCGWRKRGSSLQMSPRSGWGKKGSLEIILSKCPVKQVAQDQVQVVLEHLQRRKLYNLPAQPLPGLSHPESKEGGTLSWCQSFMWQLREPRHLAWLKQPAFSLVCLVKWFPAVVWYTESIQSCAAGCIPLWAVIPVEKCRLRGIGCSCPEFFLSRWCL